MGYITKLVVDQCRNVQHLDLDLQLPGEARPRHLILTGPNGSGKSGVLGAIATEVGAGTSGGLNPIPQMEANIALWRSQLAQNPGLKPHIARTEDQVRTTRAQRPAILTWDVDNNALASEFREGHFIAVYLEAKRQLLSPNNVAGPQKMMWTPQQLPPTTKLGPAFLQFLVNKKTEQAFAVADRDTATSDEIENWFIDLWAQIARVLEEPKLEVVFDRTNYNFLFRRADGYKFSFSTLADGHAAVMGILAEIILRIDTADRTRGVRTPQPSGVVIIDEVESHLHLKLQEDIFPFLVALFPNVQFILATHSPAIIASVPKALVYDFASGRLAQSEDFQGVRYGALVTGHFGVADDVDLDSTEKLRTLRELANRERNDAEEALFRETVITLTRRSPSMALEVWLATGGKHGEAVRD